MARDKTDAERDKIRQTERRLEIAGQFLDSAVQNRMKAKTWGVITVTAVIENGFIKEVCLDDRTVIRDIPMNEIVFGGLTKTETKA